MGIGPDTVSSSQPLSGSLGHPPSCMTWVSWTLRHDKIFLTVIMKCQEGLNYSLQTTKLERIWKSYTGVAFWFFSINRTSRCISLLHCTPFMCVIPMGLMPVFWFEASHQMCQAPRASARWERGFPVISSIWCGKRTRRICLFPMLQTALFGTASFLLTFRSMAFKSHGREFESA